MISGPALDPAKSLVLGPLRVMPREFPNVRSRAIDLVLPAAGARRDALASLVAAEIASEAVDETVAFRWRRQSGHVWLQAVPHPHAIRLEDLQGIDRQREVLERMTVFLTAPA